MSSISAVFSTPLIPSDVMCALLHLLMIVATWLAADNLRAQSTTIKSRAQTIIYYARCRILLDLFTNSALPRRAVGNSPQQDLGPPRKSRLPLPNYPATSHVLETCRPLYENLSNYIRWIIGLSQGDIPHKKCFKTPKASVFT